MAGPILKQDLSSGLGTEIDGKFPKHAVRIAGTVDLLTLEEGHYDYEGAVNVAQNYPYTSAWEHYTITVFGWKMQDGTNNGYRVITLVNATGITYQNVQGWSSWIGWKQLKYAKDLMPFALIPDSVDANNYITNGIYQIASNGSTLTNFPSGNTGGLLIVSPGSHDRWMTQQYNAQNGKMYYRSSADATGGVRAWSAWKEIASIELIAITTLLNGWVFWNNVSFGMRQLTKVGNIVTIDLMVSNPTQTLNPILTIPAGFRPAMNLIVGCSMLNSPYSSPVQILTDGTVQCAVVAPTANNWLHIHATYQI